MILLLGTMLLIGMLIGGIIDGVDGINSVLEIFQSIIWILAVNGIYAIYTYIKNKDDVDPFA